MLREEPGIEPGSFLFGRRDPPALSGGGREKMATSVAKDRLHVPIEECVTDAQRQ